MRRGVKKSDTRNAGVLHIAARILYAPKLRTVINYEEVIKVRGKWKPYYIIRCVPQVRVAAVYLKFKINIPCLIFMVPAVEIMIHTLYTILYSYSSVPMHLNYNIILYRYLHVYEMLYL